MTKKVLVLAEGQTEEAFIKQVLAPTLAGLWLVPTVVKTKVTGARPEKGGSVPYQEFRRQLNLLLRDSFARVVTTMVDYQGLGADFPGRKAPEGATPRERVGFVEAAMKTDLNDSRYRPFVVLREFEALLFAKPAVIASVLRKPALAKRLQAVRDEYSATPEEINDSPVTSPSARIESACAELCGSARVFRRRTHGPSIAGRIGLDQIRRACPHFDGWVKSLLEIAAS